MKDYIAIFNEIVEIMHKDYSGCKDKEGWDNPQIYEAEIKAKVGAGDMSGADFKSIVEDYLDEFRDGHVFFNLNGEASEYSDFSNGFSVRRYEDKLYVISTDEEKELKIKDKITALDGKSIMDVKPLYKKLDESYAEREDWRRVIKRYSSCTVEKEDGTIINMNLKRYPLKKVPGEYSIKQLGEHTALIKVTDFLDENSVVSLINDNKDLLDNCCNLIIDVRVNHGGSDTASIPLLNYAFKEKTSLNEIGKGKYQYFNYTKRNCDGLLSLYNEFINSDVSDETKKIISREIIRVKDNYDKGFVLRNDDSDEDIIIDGRKKPEHVYILSDVYCGSSGDQFVENCRESSKVMVIGRPTAGVTDYSNLIILPMGKDFEFLYPTSRRSAIDDGRGYTGKGVPVDKYIPWTPKHLDRDVDLEYTLSLIDEL